MTTIGIRVSLFQGDHVIRCKEDGLRVNVYRWGPANCPVFSYYPGWTEKVDLESRLSDDVHTLYTVVTATSEYDGRLCGTSWYVRKAFLTEEDARRYAEEYERWGRQHAERRKPHWQDEWGVKYFAYAWVVKASR